MLVIVAEQKQRKLLEAKSIGPDTQRQVLAPALAARLSAAFTNNFTSPSLSFSTVNEGGEVSQNLLQRLVCFFFFFPPQKRIKKEPAYMGYRVNACET